jgi:tRNA G18 (ribose-2'-O)-methylase SpoU
MSSRPPERSETGASAATDGSAGASRSSEPGDAAEVGVGPHPTPWPDDERLDPELLEHGDRRNVLDRYRYWSVDAIVADLDTSRNALHVAIENWEHDFNIGTVIRNANAFNAAGVHVIGPHRWDRRGAMSTHRYLHLHHHPNVESFAAWCTEAELAIIAIDNVDGSLPLESSELPEHCVLVFGQEGPGLSSDVFDVAAATYAITQYGSTRSVNAGVASGIAMFAWALQHAPSAT